MEQNTPATLSVVVVKEDDYWIAQCLEYNMIAKSKELKDLPEKFAIMIFAHVEVRLRAGQEPFVGIPKAPEKYQQIFREGLDLGLDVAFQPELPTLPVMSARKMPHLEARVA